jgi:hypothetical protein
MSSIARQRLHTKIQAASQYQNYNEVIFNIGRAPCERVNQDQHTSEADDGGVTFGGRFTVYHDTLEPFQFSHRLFDPSAGFVEQL